MTLTPTQAQAHHNPGPCAIHWRHRSLSATQDSVRRLIRCSVRRWSVPGGYRQALDVARCESGLRPDAVGGSNLGVFQHQAAYWPGRADRFLRPRWEIPHNPFNARANVIVTARMVHSSQSWSPWSCA